MSLLVATRPSERHKAVFDTNSAITGAVGVVAGVANVNPAVLLVSLLAYEAASTEALFGRPTQRMESPANRIGDVLVGMVGYMVGEWIRRDRPEWLAAARRHLNGPHV